MKVFMTGGTGYIGSAVAAHLLELSHEVSVLARHSSDTEALESLGARIVRGNLSDLDGLRSEIASHDAFIHAAASQSSTAVADDRTAIEVFGSMPRGTFVYTSGVWVFGNTGDAAVTESSPVNPLPIVAWRPPHEDLVISAATSHLKTAVIRPGCVYGGRRSMFGSWFSSIENGEPVQIVGDGSNRWSLIELRDLSVCYGLILDRGESGTFHATNDSRETLNDLARATIAARGSDVGIEHVPIETAREVHGDFADALAVDQHVRSDETRARLGWTLSVPEYVGSTARQWSEWRAR